jgi:quinol monooxygenase YgiN
MADLQVVAVLTAKPGSEDVVRTAMTALVAPTRGEEGCLSYSLYESAVAPGVFVTIESWRGQADLDAHMQTEHIAATLAAAGDALAEPPAIHPLVPIDVA